MKEINLNSLSVFLKVANTKNFLEAANRLYISQPAISKSMSKLEENLKVHYFIEQTKASH